MGRFSIKWIWTAFVFAWGSFAFAETKIIRWTGAEDSNGSIDRVLQVLSAKLSYPFKKAQFVRQENRYLANSYYERWVQVVDQTPIHGKSVRIWRGSVSPYRLIQAEANVAVGGGIAQAMHRLESEGKSASEIKAELSGDETLALVRERVQTYSQDPNIRGLAWSDEWRGGDLFRLVKVRGKSGIHEILINLHSKVVDSYQYKEFPQGDLEDASDFSIPAQAYPIYEETGGKILSREPVELRYIRSWVPKVAGDIYAPLKTQHFYDFKFDPVLGESAVGRAQGYWAMSYLKRQAAQIRNSLSYARNDWNNGVLLQGKYATINIHPDGVQKFAPTTFRPQSSAPLFPDWRSVSVDGRMSEEMILGTAFSGKPLFSSQDALNRPAQRLPDHNPATYLNDGFDEIQVYYAINLMFEALRTRGFTDPDLSTRPFNAFLYNPDISYQDNAYYTDDTINFTTYSSQSENMARDNTTIWHELGHGVMDRLMGDSIELADTGGLSEGMADFVAAMVVQAVKNGEAFPGSDQFRIINKTGFYLTNEVHDDGEAYGGAMKDFMDAVIRREGPQALTKVADVVLEAMRLTRDHPGLTAPMWFEHLIFADSLGHSGVRTPGELKSDILAALAGRNFKMDGTAIASFTLVNAADHKEIVAGAPGSRQAPITVNIPQTGTADFNLQASLKGSSDYAFHYPVELKVQFNGGPLQGAIHWTGEENGTRSIQVNSDAELAKIPLQVTGTCDRVNRPDGTCVDYAYVQVWNNGEDRPVAKKRFYLRIKNN